MHSFILLSVTFFGILISLDGYSQTDKCVPIANNTVGRINCEHGKHIHIENMWLDEKACLIQPSTTGSIVTQITDITCQNISQCTIPFRSGVHRYFNIWFQCTDCQSVSQGKLMSIRCPHNTSIRIQDVWRNGLSDCPAYKFTHRINHYRDYRSCTGKQNCDVSSDEKTSIYFYCEALPVSNNSCPICLLDETCLTIKEDSTKSITCGNDNMIDISKAWIDKSYCKRANFIAGNAINKTTDIFSICNVTSKCDIPYHTGKNGNNQLKIIYKCKVPVGNRVKEQTKKPFPGGAIAGGVVAGFLLILLPVGVFLYRRQHNDSIRSSQKKIVTRSNPTYESDMDVGTDENLNKNMESSLYHQYVEVVNDQDFDRTRQNYVNTDSTTYARENNSIKDDTYNNIQQRFGGKQQSEEIDSNMYSHLQDTCNDSDDTTYNHAIHLRIQDKSENEYYVSRGQMSDDDYDLSGNHNRANHKDGFDSVYN